jgi:hypothetical protein
VTAEEYATVQERLVDCRDALARARPGRADGALVLDELRNAIALVSVMCRDGRARTEGDGTLAGIPPATRQKLAESLRPVVTAHERLWSARNRLGGLPDSRAWLDHLVDCYETGEADHTWNGVHA